MFRGRAKSSRTLICLLALVSLLAAGCAQQAAVTKDEATSDAARSETIELEYRLMGSATTIDTAAEMIARRLSQGQVSAQLTLRGEDRILISFPETTALDVAALRQLIESPGELWFRPVDEENSEAFFTGLSEQLPEGFALKFALKMVGENHHAITHGDLDALRRFFADKSPPNAVIGFHYHPTFIDRGDDLVIGQEPRYLDAESTYWSSFLLLPEARLTGAHLEKASVQIDTAFNLPYVALEFTREGSELLAALTADTIGRRLAIMIGDEVISAPVVMESIRAGRLMLTPGVPGTFRQLSGEATELEGRIQGQMPIPVEFVP